MRIREILQAADMTEEVAVSKPVTMESPADALDAPIGGDELQHFLEMITIVAESGAGLAAFIYKVRTMLKPDEKIAIKDPVSGRSLGTITDSTSSEEIAGMVGT